MKSIIFFEKFHAIAYPVPCFFHTIVYPKFVWGGGGRDPPVLISNLHYTDTKTFPFVFVLFPFHFCSHSSHAFLFSCQFSFISCPSDVPLISLSVRLIFLLIFLSCPFHFTLLSLQFPSLFPSSHAVFLVCPVILGRKIEFPRMFVSYSFHSPWFFIFFHARLCFFSILYFFRCSAIFLSFYVTLCVYFISFPFPFMRVTSMSFHYLFISFHCPSMPCPNPHR